MQLAKSSIGVRSVLVLDIANVVTNNASRVVDSKKIYNILIVL